MVATTPPATARAPRILLVGAGAVGIAYGYYLQAGGAAVSYLVRPKYAAELAAGTNVYLLRRRGERTPIRFEGFEVLTSGAEVAARSFEQVWLCMSSTALRQPWLDGFLQAVAAGSPDATLVMLQPGATDREHLMARFPKARLVGGLITLIAYQTPLPGEAPHPPGVAIAIPPLTKFPVRGEPARARAVADAIRRGGWKSKVEGPLEDKGGAIAGAVLQSHIVALEGAGWRFASLFASPLRRLACDAAREGMVVFAKHLERGRPFGRHFVRPFTMGLFLRLARWRLPFDFEVYLEYHFMKVRDQTIDGLATTIRLGQQHGLSTRALEDLQRQVFGGAPVSQGA